jgi:hypothetical protein
MSDGNTGCMAFAGVGVGQVRHEQDTAAAASLIVLRLKWRSCGLAAYGGSWHHDGIVLKYQSMSCFSANSLVVLLAGSCDYSRTAESGGKKGLGVSLPVLMHFQKLHLPLK